VGKIVYTRGTTYAVGITYSNTSGVAGAYALMTVKSSPGYDTDATDSQSIIPPKEVTMVAGAATITIQPSDVGLNTPPGNYYYSVKVIDTEDEEYVIDSGTFKLVVVSTNRTS
jgi:hypothetical protein